VGNLFGTDLPEIIASVESERGATAATIAQDVGSTNRLAETGAYAEALALLGRSLQIHCDGPELHTARRWALKNLDRARLPEARRAYGNRFTGREPLAASEPPSRGPRPPLPPRFRPRKSATHN